MTIIKLKQLPKTVSDFRLIEIHSQFDTLLTELRKRALPEAIVQTINKEVEEINADYSIISKDFRKLIKKKQTEILRLIEKDLKLVPKKYYRTLWLALGMTAFGIPIGVATGVLIGNPSLFMLGLPIGVAIGVTVGTTLDKKAVKENRQLNLEIKY